MPLKLSQQSTLTVDVNGNLNGNLKWNQNRNLNGHLNGNLKGKQDVNLNGNLNGKLDVRGIGMGVCMGT